MATKDFLLKLTYKGLISPEEFLQCYGEIKKLDKDLGLGEYELFRFNGIMYELYVADFANKRHINWRIVD